MYYVRNTMYVVRLDGVGLDYSPTRLCLGLFFPSMVEMMMMRRRRKIIRKSIGLNISLSVVSTIYVNLYMRQLQMFQKVEYGGWVDFQSGSRVLKKVF